MSAGDARPHVLGIDVGGTKLAAGVLAPNGTLLGWRSIPSAVEDGPDRMIERHVGLAREVLDASGVGERIGLVGIACGGPLDPVAGTVHEPPNLPGWVDVPIVARFADAFGRPAVLDNDATAALLAELWFGAARGANDAVYLTISTGIGGGAVLDGHPRRGAWGNGAEFGHVSVDLNGWPCACGRRGCLEAFASGTNIARRAREALDRADAPPSLLRSLAGSVDAIRAEHVVEAARRGDAVASAVWDATTLVLGEGLVTILHAFNPEVVVIGGGVSAAGDLLLEPLRRAAASALPPAARARIVLAALGPQLGVVGAAAVALERIGLGPPPSSRTLDPSPSPPATEEPDA